MEAEIDNITMIALVEAEKIEVSDEDVEEQLKKIAEQYRMELDQLKESMGEDERKNIERELKVEKAIDLILENAVEE